MASQGSKAKGRKGKIGRNKHRIASYYGSGRYEFNKLRGLRKHLLRFPNDYPARVVAKALVAALPLNLSRQFREEF